MKSIQTKIILLIMIVITLCVAVVGGSSIMYAQKASEQNSAQIMNLTCQEKGKQLDNLFCSIEQSVKIIAHNALREQDMEHLLKSKTQREWYLNLLRPVLYGAANSTDGAVAVYLHFAPEVAPGDLGLFYSRSHLQESFREQTPTDLTAEGLDPDTLDWYYKPVETGRALWLEPYNNGKSEEKVISYVMPIYQDDVLIGVVGMDVLFRDIVDQISGVVAYDTGYAYLLDQDGQIIYHPHEGARSPVEENEKAWKEYIRKAAVNTEGNLIFEHNSQGEKYKLVSCQLENDTQLVVTASSAEIDRQKNQLVRNMGIGVSLIYVFCILISVIISQGIIRPLKEITEVSKAIAAGDLNVTLKSNSHDEVGELTESLQKTVECLRVYMDRMSNLAYTDPLTGVKSKIAYMEEVRKINNNIQLGFHQFGVIMFDINGLKDMNDTYGHENGDAYIVNCCRLICTIFKHSPVFRIGGDEFAAILVGQDLAKSSQLMEKLYKRMEEQNQNVDGPEDVISVAAGMAVFDKEKDKIFNDVFKRADKAMYEHKKTMKSQKNAKKPG